MQLNRPAAYLFLFAGMAVVGSYVALSKPLVAVIPIFVLAMLRFGIAAIAMIPWTRTRAGDVSRSDWWLLLWQSFFGNFLFSICMLNGVALTSASAAGIILSTLPAVVAVMSAFFLRERLTPRAMVAVVLAVVGIAVLQLTRAGAASAGTSADVVLGNLLVFASVCCEATYVVIGKRLTANLSAMRISALINLFGLLLILPFGLWQASTFSLKVLGAADWGLLVYYSIAASTLATWLWLTGLKTVPANHAGVFTVALPISSTLIAVTILGETLTAAHVIAFACAVAGIVLIASTRGQETAGRQVG